VWKTKTEDQNNESNGDNDVSRDIIIIYDGKGDVEDREENDIPWEEVRATSPKKRGTDWKDIAVAMSTSRESNRSDYAEKDDGDEK